MPTMQAVKRWSRMLNVDSHWKRTRTVPGMPVKFEPNHELLGTCTFFLPPLAISTNPKTTQNVSAIGDQSKKSKATLKPQIISISSKDYNHLHGKFVYFLSGKSETINTYSGWIENRNHGSLLRVPARKHTSYESDSKQRKSDSKFIECILHPNQKLYTNPASTYWQKPLSINLLQCSWTSIRLHSWKSRQLWNFIACLI